VHDLKLHLAKSQVNVSAEVLEKAILLPEEWSNEEVSRVYPKMHEMLFHNPFAKSKKKKGKKKKKKKSK
jgi:hypothetical protein